MGTLKGKKIVLGVTGGIAAYKAAELARLFIKAEAEVRVVMTESACRLITPFTFQALTGFPVVSGMWEPDQVIEIGHISLADWADVVVIAPATANIIGKISGGIADDFLSTFVMAVTAPIIICPAMNVNMYENSIVQENMTRLIKHGYLLVDPGHGALACGTEGQGRLAELEDIVDEVESSLMEKDLSGLSVVVSAGPSREKWDDIRFLSNISSGRMGIALAKNARQRGASVTLVAGPITLEPPYGVETVSVVSTEEMKEAVVARMDQADVLVMAAAPGDFKPVIAQGKVKKGDSPKPIELESTPDILAAIGKNKRDKILVGFAAESENLIENARKKLEKKNLDMIVGNQIGAPGTAFATETNQVSIISADGSLEELPMLPKEEVAEKIWDRVVTIVKNRRG